MSLTEQRFTFNSVAEAYDAARPGYPAEVFDHLAQVAGLKAGDRVLEVGCGTGLATKHLVERGLHVVAIDPGEDMIAVARRRLGSGPDLQVSGFETYEGEPSSFSAVVSAQAWHWIPETLSYARAARLLRPAGVLAIVGNVLGAPPPELIARFGPIYRRHAPALFGAPGDDWYRPAGPILALIGASGCFEPAEHQAWAWNETQTTAQYIARLGTLSGYLLLPEAARSALFGDLAASIDASGGRIPLSHETHLYLARRTHGR